MVESLEAPYNNISIYADTEIEKSLRVKSVSKEPETVSWIESMEPGEIFFDIGACVGTYSLVAASRGLKVYAFEPAPFNLDRIFDNAELNSLHITAYPYAIGDYTGRCGMKWSSEEAGSALHKMTQGTDVPISTLNDLISIVPVPDHVKIDVDGSEYLVVHGGMRVWPLVKSVQIEIDDSLTGWEEALRLLSANGLRITQWTRHGSTSISNVLLRRLT